MSDTIPVFGLPKIITDPHAAHYPDPIEKMKRWDFENKTMGYFPVIGCFIGLQRITNVFYEVVETKLFPLFGSIPEPHPRGIDYSNPFLTYLRGMVELFGLGFLFLIIDAIASNQQERNELLSPG